MERKKTNKKRNFKKIIAAVALVGCIATGGMFAYLTDVENANNVFTVGNIDIELTEPNWNPDEGKNVVPNEEIEKDPTIKNVGSNSAYVFAEVTIPKANVLIAAQDGTKNPAGESVVDLFTLEGLNSDWTLLKTESNPNSTKYVYVYGGETTPTEVAPEATVGLFTSVKVVNFVEGYIAAGTEYTVSVKAKAIQKDALTADANNSEAIYNIILNQQK